LSHLKVLTTESPFFLAVKVPFRVHSRKIIIIIKETLSFSFYFTLDIR